MSHRSNGEFNIYGKDCMLTKKNYYVLDSERIEITSYFVYTFFFLDKS